VNDSEIIPTPDGGEIWAYLGVDGNWHLSVSENDENRDGLCAIVRLDASAATKLHEFLEALIRTLGIEIEDEL